MLVGFYFRALVVYEGRLANALHLSAFQHSPLLTLYILPLSSILLAFSHLTSILLFVLPLNLLTSALPSPIPSSHKALAAWGTGHDVLIVVADLEVKIKDRCNTLVRDKI